MTDGPDRYRRYLLFLDGFQVGPDLEAKLDVEGVVQQTLVMAHHRLGQAEQARVRMAELRALPGAKAAEVTAEAEALTAGRAK